MYALLFQSNDLQLYLRIQHGAVAVSVHLELWLADGFGSSAQTTHWRQEPLFPLFLCVFAAYHSILSAEEKGNLSLATFHKLLAFVVCINANKSSLTQAWQLLFRGPHPPAAFLPPLDSSYWCFRFFLLPTLSVLWVLLLPREFFIFQGAYYNSTFCE